MVGYGTVVRRGSLPVYSVDNVAQAQQLIKLTCRRQIDGTYIAQELAIEQTLPVLYAFGRRLKTMHEKLEVNNALAKETEVDNSMDHLLNSKWHRDKPLCEWCEMATSADREMGNEATDIEATYKVAFTNLEGELLEQVVLCAECVRRGVRFNGQNAEPHD